MKKKGRVIVSLAGTATAELYVMAAKQAAEICKQVDNRNLLKRMHISLLDEIAYHLEKWEQLAPFIELSDADQQEIKEDYDHQYRLQKREALRRWRDKVGNAATVKTFAYILCKQKLVSLAETVVNISQKPPKQILIFSKYLRKFYIEEFSQTACNQWPSLLEGFDLPSVYIDLKFHEVPLNETKGVPSKTRGNRTQRCVPKTTWK